MHVSGSETLSLCHVLGLSRSVGVCVFLPNATICSTKFQRNIGKLIKRLLQGYLVP